MARTIKTCSNGEPKPRVRYGKKTGGETTDYYFGHKVSRNVTMVERGKAPGSTIVSYMAQGEVGG
jgi:hypothetical protein